MLGHSIGGVFQELLRFATGSAPGSGGAHEKWSATTTLARACLEDHSSRDICWRSAAQVRHANLRYPKRAAPLIRDSGALVSWFETEPAILLTLVLPWADFFRVGARDGPELHIVGRRFPCTLTTRGWWQR